MKCWVCSREARGLGHLDGRFKTADPRRYRPDWVFCSRRCQDTFHAMYGRWADTDPPRQEIFMIDATDAERAALRACLKPFGEAAEEIGFDKPLGAYSEAEALAVIDAIVTTWTETMATHHATTKHAPIAGHHLQSGNLFDEMPDDLPWEVR